MPDFIDFEVLMDLQNALELAKLTIEVLSRNNTTLYSASLTLEYMQKNIADSTSMIYRLCYYKI
jgi:DNA repair protein RadC